MAEASELIDGSIAYWRDLTTISVNPHSAAETLLVGTPFTHSIPLDVEALAVHLGIQVREMELEESVRGAVVIEPHTDPVLLVHDDWQGRKRRVSVAHLLGHAVCKIRQGVEQCSMIDTMEPPPDDPNRPEEIYALRFTESLLMPEGLLRNSWSRDPNAFELAERLDVDLDDLCERLRVLEIG